jgi:predicted solute-binding protein
MTERKTRVGAPYYLCVRPLLFGMTREHQDNIELVYHESGTLAEMLEMGKLDAALIPSTEFLRGCGTYYVNGPGLATQAMRGSIILVAKTELERINRIAVDEFTRTPIAALRIVLDSLHHMLPDILVAKNAEKDWQEYFDAILLCGDKALHYLHEPSHNGEKVYDVVSMWYKLTAKPLVVFLWAFNDEKREGLLGKVFRSSRNLGIKNMSLLSDGLAQTTPFGSAFLYDYLSRNWTYELGEAETEGLKLLEEYSLRYKLLRKGRLAKSTVLSGS